MEYVEKGLVKNIHNIKARGLKAAILRKLGRKEEAAAWIEENLKVDPFDFLSGFEKIFVNYAGEGCVRCAARESREEREALVSLMRGFHENFLMIARDYAESGMYREALAVLDCCTQEKPMLRYYKGIYLQKLLIL